MSSPTSDSQTHKLFTFASGGWVILLAAILCSLAAAVMLWPLYKTGFHPAVGDGHNPATYGFDLSNLDLPRDTFVAAVSKDEIRAIPPSMIQTITPAAVLLRNEHEIEEGRFLVGSDRVIGVSLNGESRAYPLRVMNYHEVANDVLGGVPIVVTYSPLCDSAVVFDRRVDGPASQPVEFGVSGLLTNSDLLMFDRRRNSKDESLWPQLTMKAVSGPRLGKHLVTVDFAVMTWRRWTELHPDTRVLEGLRTLKSMYKQEPFNTYFASDDLKFPVGPVWDEPGVAKKTKIVVESLDGGKTWIAQRPGLTGAPTQPVATQPAKTTIAASKTPPPIRAYSFVFAWYAQHPDDTDYSGILK